MNSLNPPETCGNLAALPKNRTSEQRLERPSLHCAQTPQVLLGLTATRSPVETFVTPEPMAATVPATSCPRIIGSRSLKSPTPPSL